MKECAGRGDRTRGGGGRMALATCMPRGHASDRAAVPGLILKCVWNGVEWGRRLNCVWNGVRGLKLNPHPNTCASFMGQYPHIPQGIIVQIVECKQ